MADVALDMAYPPAAVALIPASVEVLGGRPELHNEVA
jgi:hypothetical protein